MKFILKVCVFFFISLSFAFAEDTRLKIAVICPLTGSLAEYGIATGNAIKLALERNPEISKKINFIFGDNSSDNSKTISAFNKVLAIDKVDLILVWGIGPAQALAPIAEARKVPLISISAERIISIGKKYHIRFGFFAEQIGEALLKYYRGQGIKNFGLIKTEHAFTSAIADGFISNLAKDEHAEIIDTYQMTDQDFAPSILKAKTKNYGALGVLLWTGQISRFFKQARDLGAKFNSFGPHLFESYSELKHAEGSMEGAVFAVLNHSEEFRSLYLQKFGNDNRVSFAALGFDFAMLCEKLFSENSQKLSAEEILAKFRNSPKQHGAVGEYYYVDNEYEGPSFRFQVKIKKIVDAKIVADSIL